MYNDIAEVSLIQPYHCSPPMMCKTMTDRGAHPSRADPGVPSLGKLVYASSSVAQELLSSPSLPQACLSQIPASLCPPDYQLTKVVALPDPRHTLVMPLFRIAVALCGPSIIILSHPTYPPSSSSFPSRHILPKHHQALYTDCCLLPCDCALPANTIHQGRHSLQHPPSTAFHLRSDIHLTHYVDHYLTSRSFALAIQRRRRPCAPRNCNHKTQTCRRQSCKVEQAPIWRQRWNSGDKYLRRLDMEYGWSLLRQW